MNNSNISIENAKIMFRNFSGRANDYNDEGNRNFCVVIDDPDMAADMVQEGWNVRYLEPSGPDEDPVPYIQVRVAFGYRPPNIVMITGGNMTRLGEDEVHLLDSAEIEKVDMIVSPYHWTYGKKTGIKGYLKAIYVTIVEDELERKYRSMIDQKDLPF